MVPLGELGEVRRSVEEQPIYRKDLRQVAMVMADTAGISPVNEVLWLEDHTANLLPAGYTIDWTGEGEWNITVTVFRDLGLAFGAALFFIYVLLVAQTESLAMPLIIMAAIPLTLIGIMPGFFVLDLLTNRPVAGFPDPTFFTATAMIGMIALAGIVVRNSIILIDFIHHSLARGLNLEDAVSRSGRNPPAADRSDRRRRDVGFSGDHAGPDFLGPCVGVHLRNLRLDRVHADRGAAYLLHGLS